jgi:hypothetical protein
MATNAAVVDGRVTLFDFHKELGAKGDMLPVVETLNQTNDVFQDAPVTPSNAMLGHTTEFRTGLPAISVGAFNRGTPKSKETAEQHQETIATFKTRVEIDLEFKRKLGAEKFNIKKMNAAQARAEAFSQFVAGKLLYGTVAGAGGDLSTFDGFITRMPVLQAPRPGSNGSQVVSNGVVAGGDGTSMLIVDWHPTRGCHLIYPEGSENAGLTAKVLGDDETGLPVFDADGNSFNAAVTEYIWDVGLAVEDPRRMARIPNIDISDAQLGNQATQFQLLDTLDRVLGLMPKAVGRRCIYACPDLITALSLQVRHASTTLLISMDEYLNTEVLMYKKIPIRRIDQFSISEGTVS